MGNNEFWESWAGVFADEGFWINGDDEKIEISEMGPEYRRATIKHLFKILPYLDECKTSPNTPLTYFSGENANKVANKLEELGCQVVLEGDYFAVDLERYK